MEQHGHDCKRSDTEEVCSFLRLDNTSDDLYRDLFMAAMEGCYLGVEHILLLDYEEDTSLTYGYTALHAAASMGRLSGWRAELRRWKNKVLEEFCYLRIVELLLFAGSRPDVTDNSGSTPLHYAARYGTDIIMHELVQNNDSWRPLVDDEGRTLTHFTAAYRGKDILQNVLEKEDLPLDATDKNGNTALHYAILHGNVENAKLLITLGADVNAATIHGARPIFLATESDKEGELIDCLIAAGAEANVVCPSTKNTAIKIILDKLFLTTENGRYNQDDVLYQGHTSNIKFCQKDKKKYDEYMKCVKLLLQNGASPNCKTYDNLSPVVHAMSIRWRLLDGYRPSRIDKYMSDATLVKIHKDLGELIRLLVSSGSPAEKIPTLFALHDEPKYIRQLINLGFNFYDETEVATLKNSYKHQTDPCYVTDPENIANLHILLVHMVISAGLVRVVKQPSPFYLSVLILLEKKHSSPILALDPIFTPIDYTYKGETVQAGHEYSKVLNLLAMYLDCNEQEIFASLRPQHDSISEGDFEKWVHHIIKKEVSLLRSSYLKERDTILNVLRLIENNTSVVPCLNTLAAGATRSSLLLGNHKMSFAKKVDTLCIPASWKHHLLADERIKVTHYVDEESNS